MLAPAMATSRPERPLRRFRDEVAASCVRSHQFLVSVPENVAAELARTNLAVFGAVIASVPVVCDPSLTVIANVSVFPETVP
jgi:hypothetical protein